LEQIKLFDTTLRDGTQGEKICLSLEDKISIAKRLDNFGIHYIEGGWPGSNPKDQTFFERASKESWNNASIVAFGSTRRVGISPDKDNNLNLLLSSETPAVSMFGKTWIMHATVALGATPEENLQMIYDSLKYMKKHGREVIYDAEHFFDGYKDNPEYAIRTLHAAVDGGADVLVLCDTNGGNLPYEIFDITRKVKNLFDMSLGIHAHNDSDLAVANSIAAIQAGAVHVQGTINGFGERCGNANLISIIPNLQLKLGYQCVDPSSLASLSDLSAYVNEMANMVPRDEAAYVGKSAFAHKGGIHVSAVMKQPKTYEHIDPQEVGNSRRVLISDLSGRSNVCYKMSELGLQDLDNKNASEIVQHIKKLENQGYSFEAAEASFELLVERYRNHPPVYFQLSGFRELTEKDGTKFPRSEASIRVTVDEHEEHTAAEGNGPVNALDNALRKALTRFFPEIAMLHLIDYKVRVLNEAGKSGTASRVRVLIVTQYENNRWSTIGVSENIIEASWEALVDSYTYFLHKKHKFFSRKEHQNEEASIYI
jgi:2-isopropylmalate synthase